MNEKQRVPSSKWTLTLIEKLHRVLKERGICEQTALLEIYRIMKKRKTPSSPDRQSKDLF